jgi:hypothetical protein
LVLVTAILAMPGEVQANNQDVPTVLNTGPELQQSVFGTTLSTMNTDSLVIETYVDQNGRVQDYKILSDPGESQELLPQVKRMLIFTTFRPAMSMGTANLVAGGAVILEDQRARVGLRLPRFGFAQHI